MLNERMVDTVSAGRVFTQVTNWSSSMKPENMEENQRNEDF